MQEFKHIQSLWHSHKVELKISSGEMLMQVKKEVGSIKKRSLFNIAGMLLSFVAIAALWVFFDFQSWTTHAGITIIITAIAIYTFILYRGYMLISRNDFTAHPKEFLNQLKIYQLNRFNLYNRLYWFYAAALSFGSLLFFYETLSSLSILIQCGIILLTAFWIVICATVLRHAYMRKEKERIDLLIEKFERINAQFKEQ